MAEKQSLEEQKTELLAILNRTTARNFRVLPALGTTKLLKVFDLSEIESALSALAKDKWHRERIKELSSDYLLRATTIDKWLQRAQSQPKTNQPVDEELVTI